MHTRVVLKSDEHLPSQWIAGIPFFNTSHLRAQSFEFNLGPPRSGSNMRFCGNQIDVVTQHHVTSASRSNTSLRAYMVTCV